MMDEALIVQYPDLEASHFWWETRRSFVGDLLDQIWTDGTTSVLDIGCGSGMTSRMVARMGGDVVGVDVEFGGGGDAQDEVTWVRSDYLRVTGDLGEFDIVLALDSVEHFADEKIVLEAIASNTKAYGYALITVPAYSWLWSRHDDENLHYRRYTKKALTYGLMEAGFAVERVGYIFGTLLPVKSLLTAAERITRRRSTSGTKISRRLNRLALRFFEVEMKVALRLRNFLPFGTSVAALARKRPHQHIQGAEDSAEEVTE